MNCIVCSLTFNTTTSFRAHLISKTHIQSAILHGQIQGGASTEPLQLTHKELEPNDGKAIATTKPAACQCNPTCATICKNRYPAWLFTDGKNYKPPTPAYTVPSLNSPELYIKPESEGGPKMYECVYCSQTYKHHSSKYRHESTCKRKISVEKYLAENNMTLEEYIKFRNITGLIIGSKQPGGSSQPTRINTSTTNSHNINNTNQYTNSGNTNSGNTYNNTMDIKIDLSTHNTLNVGSANSLPDINPFGKETFDHILQDRELALMILRKLDYGVNCLFFETYNLEKNRNIYLPYKNRDTVATLEPTMKIKHNKYSHIVDIVFARIHRIYSKLYDKYESELTERERRIVGRIIENYNSHGIAKPGNHDAFTSYLDYMSKDNERLIHNYLAEKQGLQPGDKPLLTW